MEDDQGDLFQISFLLDQLKHEDSALRANAISNLPKIAKALGPVRTRNELVPFLTESTDDEDEIMTILAKKIGELRAYVGGDEYLYVLLPPLEALLSAEDTNVRDEAIKSIETLCSTNSSSSNDFVRHLSDFFTKLSTKDWHTSRMSSATIFMSLYKHLPNDSHSYRSSFYSLCCDESALVRRSSVAVLCELVTLLSLQDINTEVLPIYKRLAVDDQDNVRIQVISLSAALAKIINLESKTSQILPVLLNLAGDKSWRVRWSFCGKFAKICECFENDITNKNFGIVLETLLCDSEIEVRAAASSVISAVSKYFNLDIIVSKIIPSIHNLVNDPSEHVRVSLASSITSMSELLGKKETINHLLPLLLLLLRDESSEVRLGIISSMELINSVVGAELLNQALLPSIIDLAEDSKWRVRLAIIELIPNLASQLGHDFFNDKLNGLCISWLSDSVYSVREAATKILCRLVGQFGESWAIEFVFPSVERMLLNTNYLHRITALHCFEALFEVVSATVLEKNILPLILPCANDPVANVRFTLAKCMAKIPSNKISNIVVADIGPTLKKLSIDSDSDVNSHANRACKDLNLQ